MNAITRQRLRNRKHRIGYRLREIHWGEPPRPMLTARNIRYEVADRARGVSAGGIGAMLLLARRTGLIDALDRRVHLLKVHLPYHESDHVLNIAYNILAGGTCLEGIEHRRNDEGYLDGLGAQRIPDPTTAGDFCRRFTSADIETLMDTINEVRLGVHGDGVAGLDAEGVAGLVSAGGGALAPEAPGAEAVAPEHGVQEVPERGDASAVPDRSDGAADRVPAAVVEPLAGSDAAGGENAAGATRGRPLPAPMLAGGLDVGVRTPRFPRTPYSLWKEEEA